MQIYTLYCRVLHAMATINISWRRKFYSPFLSSRFWEHLEQLSWPWKYESLKIYIYTNCAECIMHCLAWYEIKIFKLSINICQWHYVKDKQVQSETIACHQCLHTSREIITILIEPNNTDLILEHVFFVYLYNRNRLLI